jgi:hypothetical protein
MNFLIEIENNLYKLYDLRTGIIFFIYDTKTNSYETIDYSSWTPNKTENEEIKQWLVNLIQTTPNHKIQELRFNLHNIKAEIKQESRDKKINQLLK